MAHLEDDVKRVTDVCVQDGPQDAELRVRLLACAEAGIRVLAIQRLRVDRAQPGATRVRVLLRAERSSQTGQSTPDPSQNLWRTAGPATRPNLIVAANPRGGLDAAAFHVTSSGGPNYTAQPAKAPHQTQSVGRAEAAAPAWHPCCGFEVQSASGTTVSMPMKQGKCAPAGHPPASRRCSCPRGRAAQSSTRCAPLQCSTSAPARLRVPPPAGLQATPGGRLSGSAYLHEARAITMRHHRRCGQQSRSA